MTSVQGEARPSRRTVIAGLGALTLWPDALLAQAPAKGANGSVVNRLGVSVLDRIARRHKGQNVVIAPHCLHSALVGLAAGGDDSLQKALSGTILTGPKATIESVLADCAILGSELAKSSREGVELKTAVGVWVHQDVTPEAEFKDRLNAAFAAEVAGVDFRGSDALAKINGWIGEKTEGQIPQMIDRLDPLTEFVLASALYFKGRWAQSFDPARTAPLPFRLRAGETKQTPMMAAEIDGGIWEDRKLRAISIPFGTAEAPSFQFVIVQSKDRSRPFSTRQWDLGAVLSKASFTPARIDVTIPKFAVKFESDMREALEASGLRALVSSSSKYTRISSNAVRAPVINHAVKIEVDERGATAAAATTVTATRSMTEVVRVVVDSPFAFSISHRGLNLDLVQGLIEDPAS